MNEFERNLWKDVFIKTLEGGYSDHAPDRAKAAVLAYRTLNASLTKGNMTSSGGSSIRSSTK